MHANPADKRFKMVSKQQMDLMKEHKSLCNNVTTVKDMRNKQSALKKQKHQEQSNINVSLFDSDKVSVEYLVKKMNSEDADKEISSDKQIPEVKSIREDDPFEGYRFKSKSKDIDILHLFKDSNSSTNTKAFTLKDYYYQKSKSDNKKEKEKEK